MRQYFDNAAKRDLWDIIKQYVHTYKCNRRSLESIFNRKEDSIPQDNFNINHPDESKGDSAVSSTKEIHLRRTIFKDHDLVCFVVNPVFVTIY